MNLDHENWKTFRAATIEISLSWLVAILIVSIIAWAFL